MENPEKLSWQIWEQEGMGRALLIGGLLCYIPVVNLLVLGYWARWGRQLIRREGAQLPEWREGGEIVRELVRVLPIALVWLLAPVLLAAGVTLALVGLLDFLHLDLFAYTLGLAPFTVVALFVPPALVVALVRFERSGELRDALQVAEVTGQVLRGGRELLFPLLRFYGLVVMGWPLIGLAVFAASLPLVAELVLLLEGRKTT